ncbi:His_kinase domain-containing protein [Tenacibaculum sp. 190524A02b]|uniref:sensor histidine kinase n=1 Tax=Tenacibaculum vairaonense TaxID=3137860 RepID=UPI0032B1C690
MKFISFKKNKLTLFFAIFYAFICSLHLVKVYYLKNIGYRYTNKSWSILLTDSLIDYLLVILLFVAINKTTLKLLKRKKSWKQIAFIHLAFSFLMSFSIVLGIYIFHISNGNIKLNHSIPKEILRYTISTIDINVLIYFVIILIIYSYHYLKKNEKNEKEKSSLEKQLIKTRLNLLRSNLQPHFLFNTLNSITTLIDIHPKKAQDTIIDLSSFLRELLDAKEQLTTDLFCELNTLKKYINILEVRFSDSFSFNTNIEDKTILNAKVPYLLLQPIVENSVKHGYSYNHTVLTIALTIKKKNDFIVISIENDGQLLSENFCAKKMNIGLESTIERLKSTYEKFYTFEMRNNKNKSGVITTITFPYIVLKKNTNID